MQIKFDTGDTELIRRINRFRILDAVRRLEPVSRQSVCERTGLSRSTVSIAVNMLIDEGVLCDQTSTSQETAGRGRPTSHLCLNPDAAHVVGVKLCPQSVGMVVTNLRADVLASLTLPVRPWRLEAESLCHVLDDGVRAVVAKAGMSHSQISGVSIAVPGMKGCAVDPADQDSPLIENSPLALAECLQQRFALPVSMAPEVDLLADAERWFGHGREVENFMVVKLGATIGAASYVNGTLVRGVEGAGFGHMKVGHGERCDCGQAACIDALAADRSIINQARAFMGINEDDLTESPRKVLKDIAERARGGHAQLRGIFESAGEAIGLGIANAISVVYPSRVIIAGCTAQDFELLAPSLTEAVRRNGCNSSPADIEILLQGCPEQAWGRGAASMILGKLYSHPFQRA